MRVALLLTLAAGLVAPVAAQSIYACRDASGRPVSGDRPLPECAQQPLRELRPDGSLKKEHAAPLTAAQQRERDAQEAREREARAARREQELRDRALLQAYPDEARLDAARLHALDALRAEQAATRQRMVDGHVRLRAAQAEVTRGVPDAPARVQREAAAILTEDQRLAQQGLEFERTSARFEAERARLRTLLGGTQAAQAPTR